MGRAKLLKAQLPTLGQPEPIFLQRQRQASVADALVVERLSGQMTELTEYYETFGAPPLGGDAAERCRHLDPHRHKDALTLLPRLSSYAMNTVHTSRPSATGRRIRRALGPVAFPTVAHPMNDDFTQAPRGPRFSARPVVGAYSGPGVGETREWGLVVQSPQHARHPGATSTSAGKAASGLPWWRRALSRVASRSAIKWWIIAWALLLVVATLIVWIKCPAWLTDGESGSTTIRNLGLVILAAVGLPLAIWRSVIAERQAQAAQRQSEIAGQNQLTGRFQKGVEMLGHPDFGSVRIGGIHALARLAAEHPGVFHLPIMQTLAAFVVDRTKVDREEEEQESVGPEEGNDYSGYAPFQVLLVASSEVGPVPELAKDVEEAMRAVGQRGEGQVAAENEGTFRMNLADASLPGLIFHRADFSGFDLTKADMRRVQGWEARFARARLAGADLSAAGMHGADFREADMRRVNLTAAQLVGADLRNANLGLVDLAGENLWKGTIFPSKLVGTLLAAADLRNADITGADMRGACLGSAKLDDADLRGANLSGADLRAASFRKAQLGGADMSGADLGGAGADLRGADLAGANLTGARLGNANLAGANLEGVSLTGADLSGQKPDGDASPACGLTQQQLDQAEADPAIPPIVDGILDCETNEPLRWRGASERQSGSGEE